MFKKKTKTGTNYKPFICIFLIATGLADMRNNSDANCTYEGDNNVILQQTSNWLVQMWLKRHNEKVRPYFTTLFNSVHFLLDGDEILRTKFSPAIVDELAHPEGKALTLKIKMKVEWLRPHLFISEILFG